MISGVANNTGACWYRLGREIKQQVVAGKSGILQKHVSFGSNEISDLAVVIGDILLRNIYYILIDSVLIGDIHLSFYNQQYKHY